VSRLRANVLVSAAAMVLVGLIRPGFNAIVTRAFGAEVNGRAASIIALVFLASLPATAALPTVMVRHVSRALGRGDLLEARGHARFAAIAGVLLTSLGALFAVGYGLLRPDPPLAPLELAIAVAALFGYCYWRLVRTLLLAVGKAVASLYAELASVIGMFVCLSVLVVLQQPGLVVGAFAFVYLAYAALTLSTVGGQIKDGQLAPEERRAVLRYNLLWFLGTAASLAAREIVVLLLDARVERALVGEMSLALSFLMMLALAPRIIEVPLVHELSALGGEDAQERQRVLTDKGLHWLTLLSLAAGFGMAILAGPILRLAGGVTTPVVVQAFAIVSIAFMSEMMLTPATNLLIAEAPPSVLTSIGLFSLLSAFVWWWSPLGDGVLGVIEGLALSYAIKALGIGAYARFKFGVRLFEQPIRKTLAVGLGAAAIVLSQRGELDPFLAAVAFEFTLLTLFFAELAKMKRALAG